MQIGYKIYIKGMVCDRCILTIRNELDGLQIPINEITLGEVTTLSALTAPDIKAIGEQLLPLGFTLLENKNTKLVKELKSLAEKVYAGSFDFTDGFSFSGLVAATFHKDYVSISSIFCSVEGITLEKYIIGYRIEKAKEMLVYSSYSLTDIAYKLGYSSVAHLSAQFKNETGLTPSHFKKIRQDKSQFRGSKHSIRKVS
ncbi:AraC family transcriptional regulator [Paraflavitalea sp. CAU 1676]|uniref:helix-turn-helix domain-containing protein n=1 Tax=Paraflavitalea sp. CAU 1676 TaxID=3032598 RepID=UPI0023D9BA4F|nr:AraC family transcriptional regulator [Paraflavitalea sp. CAU 1676]MDF2191348.1 AraC family transcriptional regulator [Paraflavitalea sp. CAU 1676]